MRIFLPGLTWLSIACASITLSGCGSDSGANNASNSGSGASMNTATGGTLTGGVGGTGGVSTGSGRTSTGGARTVTTGGSSAGATGGAGAGGSKMKAPVKEGWYCGQAGEGCACTPTIPGVPAVNNCTLPLAGCCFTFVLDGSAACQCQPTTLIPCAQWLAVAQGTQVTACPPP